MRKCEVCGGGLSPVIASWGPPYICLKCVAARHRGVLNKRCTCPSHLKQPRAVRAGGRQWVACDRCLAPIVAKNPRKTTKRRSKMRVV